MAGANHCDIMNKCRNDLTSKTSFYLPYVVGHNFTVCELHIELDFIVLVKSLICSTDFILFIGVAQYTFKQQYVDCTNVSLFIYNIPSFSGIVMMRRLGDDPEEIVKPVEIKKNQVETDDEPEPPAAFEYLE
jgi:hypothetical protein